VNELDLVLVVLRLAAGVWLMWSVRTPRPDGDPRVAVAEPGVDGISVVVPARDEEENLPGLLASLASNVDVVVVDDGSSDGTCRVARSCGARVVEAGEPPDGWVGKSWACHRGAAAASGGTLVFADADVRFGPGGLEAVLACHRERGGLVSVQPFHEPGSPGERLTSLFNVVAFAATDAASPLGSRRGVRGAFGPVMVTGRGVYEAVGGHDRVRSSIVDDVALSAVFRSAGESVTVLAGGEAVRFRMYPGGLGEMVEGFTKNLAAGASAVRRSTAGLVVAWITLLVQAAAAPVIALWSGGAVAGPAVLYLVVALQCWWMSRRLGSFGVGTALVFPASLALFLFVFTRSVLATVRGAVTWKGRRVTVRPQGAPPGGRPR
jgi:4,4'-diaponeurosporenoate glycosyltransferase